MYSERAPLCARFISIPCGCCAGVSHAKRGVSEACHIKTPCIGFAPSPNNLGVCSFHRIRCKISGKCKQPPDANASTRGTCSPLSNITSDPPRRAHSTGPSPTAPGKRGLAQPESLAVGTLPPSADRPRAAVRTVATTATRQTSHELMRGKSRLRKLDGPRHFRGSAGIVKALAVVENPLIAHPKGQSCVLFFSLPQLVAPKN
jgi:hypothetical protein